VRLDLHPRRPPRGAAKRRRYHLPFPIAEERALPHVPTFGGGERLVATDEDDDLAVALVEGACFRESAGATTFAPFLNDPRPPVRYTALRCFRTLFSDDAEATLLALADDPDPIVRAHVQDALKFRTWEGKKNLPGLKKERPGGR
jgi:hypothetical protein